MEGNKFRFGLTSQQQHGRFIQLAQQAVELEVEPQLLATEHSNAAELPTSSSSRRRASACLARFRLAQGLRAVGSAIGSTIFGLTIFSWPFSLPISSLTGLGDFGAGLMGNPVWAAPVAKQAETVCPKPALSRLVRHRVASGETLESIAQQYNLLSTTLIGMNPGLQQGQVTVGSEILVPPYNGIRVTVPAGSSWRDIAAQYNVRADLLFEQNGCQEAPTVVFVPGVNWSPAPAPTTSQAERSPISRLPLPEATAIALAYGWQVNPATNAVQFHSGVNIEAPTGTAVLASGAGTVAFAGEQRGYGNLVVINHSQGLQTRYGNLATIAVRVGQQVQAGSQLGTVAGVDDGLSYLHFQVRANSRLGWVAQDPGAYFQELRLGRR